MYACRASERWKSSPSFSWHASSFAVGAVASGRAPMAVAMGDEEELVAVFSRFDVDNSGGIDASELRAALEYLGLRLDGEQCDYMLRKYDDDRGESLDLNEFAQLVEDVRVNTAESMLERLTLRSHPHVSAALEGWCSAARAAPGSNEDTVFMVQHDAYVGIMCKVIKAMEEEWDEEDAMETAEAEWEHDRRGFDHLDAELFKDSIFELADLCAWAPAVLLYACSLFMLASTPRARALGHTRDETGTSSVSGEEYGDFLWELLQKVAEGTLPDRYLWKSIDDVQVRATVWSYTDHKPLDPHSPVSVFMRCVAVWGLQSTSGYGTARAGAKADT